MNKRKFAYLTTVFCLLGSLSSCDDNSESFKASKKSYPGDAAITKENYKNYFKTSYSENKYQAGTMHYSNGKTVPLYCIENSTTCWTYFADIANYDVTFIYETCSYKWDSDRGVTYSDITVTKEVKISDGKELNSFVYDDGTRYYAYKCFEFDAYSARCNLVSISGTIKLR